MAEAIFQTQQTSPHDLAIHTLAKAEQMAQTYAQIASHNINQLLNKRRDHKNIAIFDQIMTQIVNRQHNITQRAQYTIEQIILKLSNQTQSSIIQH